MNTAGEGHLGVIGKTKMRENGKFAIPNLPPGKYVFTVWQEKPGYLTKSLKVTVKAGEYTEEPLKYAAKDFAQHNGPTAKVLVLNTGR